MARAGNRARGMAPVLAASALAFAGHAFADAGWLESGDPLLRLDLQLLNDAEVIRLPLSQWPVPRAAVVYALQDAKEHFARNVAVAAALERVRARVAIAARVRKGGPFSLSAGASAGSAGLLRDFDTAAREDAEINARAGYDGERVAFSLDVSAVSVPDGERLRADGSHATAQVGNWLLGVHALDRWWGPGHESSLILSSNARPMPTLMLERATARAFETKLLRWLGPWRMSLGVSRMETERADIDAPLFLAWRVVVMPLQDMELGFSRTAQFCGRQLACDASSFFEMLIGNDNVGIDASAENEPGNQMAGFDIRWASPLGNWPYAIYGQMIGEDESSYVPAKYLAQFGLEIWKVFSDGGRLQLFTEYADTTCSAVSGSGPYYNCAYNQGRFNSEGYRFRGRVIGHTTDRDARSLAAGASFTTPDSSVWSATLRSVELNRDPTPDPTNTVSAGPADYQAIEVGWRGELWSSQLSIEAGIESIEPVNGERDSGAFGFVHWRHAF
jgi:hypothetical protein